MLRRTSSIGITALLTTLGACVERPSPTVEVQTAPPSELEWVENIESRYVVSHPTVVAVPLPERFDAPLPTAVADLDDRERFPQTSYVRLRLAAHDDSMRERFMTAITRAATAGPLPEPLQTRYLALLPPTPSEALCAALAALARDDARSSARPFALQALVRCHDPALAPLFLTAPDDLLHSWAVSLGREGPLPWSPRFDAVLRAAALDRHNDRYLGVYGTLFARMPGLEPVAALADLQAALPDDELGKRRARLGVGMIRSATPEGRAIGEESCRRLPTHPLCRPPEIARAAATSAQLAACVRDGQRPSSRLACLRALVSRDRVGAVHAAQSLLESEPTESPDAPDVVALRGLARRLVAAPAPGAFAALLDDLGLTARPDTTHDSPQPAVLDVPRALAERGRAVEFHLERGISPGRLEALYALAAAASPTLAGARFEETPLPGVRGGSTVHVYLGGKRYSVETRTFSARSDVSAWVGLLNAVLVDRGSDLRLAKTPTRYRTEGGGETTPLVFEATAFVIAAPERAFDALLATGLLTLEQPHPEDGIP